MTGSVRAGYESVQRSGGPLTLADSDEALWSQFAQPASTETFLRAWLALGCRGVQGAQAAALLLGPADQGPFTLAATWPGANADLGPLTKAAEQALGARRPAVDRAGDPAIAGARVAYPIVVADRLHGAVVVQISQPNDARVQAAMRALHWNGAWLEAHFLHVERERDAASRKRISHVVDLAALAIDCPGARPACASLVNELSTRLGCDRVSVGFLDAGHVKLSAISHNANFGKQMNLVRSLEAAMDEALDQGCSVVLPTDEHDSRITLAHLDLQQQHGSTELLTVPIRADGDVVGALTLERAARAPFEPDEIELVEGLAAFAGPVLDLKRRDDRWVVVKLWHALREQLGRLIGPRYLGRKLCALVLLGLAAYMSVATGQYVVSAPAAIEGSVQRAVVAPIDGYIARATVRPGDQVRTDEVLFTLDDRDLKLERLEVANQKAQLETEHRDLSARRERAKANIVAAQIRQAEAQLELLDAEIRRTILRAPFDALVVAGDLTQSLGAPVQRGEVLLNLAPLDEYRIILSVDERDVDAVETGQDGKLLLASLTDDAFDFRIERVTPVASAGSGTNFFRVDATLLGDSSRLRPGMEGVGKIHIAERKLAWIWTHGLLQRLRLWLWRWIP